MLTNNVVSFEQPGPDGKANSVAPIRLVLLIGGPVVFVLMLRIMIVCWHKGNNLCKCKVQ